MHSATLDKLHIVYASDEAFLLPVAVSVASAFLWTKNASRLIIDILDCGISDAVWDGWSQNLLKRIPKESKIVRHVIAPSQLDKLPKYRGSAAIWARVFIPDILNDVKWCVYLDGDTLWTEDPLELFSVFNSEYAFMGHRDIHPRDDENKKRVWHESHGYVWDRNQYCCSGFLLMNLEWFRENDATRKLINFAHKHPDVIWPDQDALYEVCFGHISFLPDNWGAIDSELWLCKSSGSGCLHYAVWKPWRLEPIKRGWYPATVTTYIKAASMLLGVRHSEIVGRPIHCLFVYDAMRPLWELMAKIVGLNRHWRERRVYIFFQWIIPRRMLRQVKAMPRMIKRKI